MSNGKGSSRRPTQADPETVAANWERTFGHTPRDVELNGATGRRLGVYVEVIDDAGVAHWLYSPAVKNRDT